jgi:pimeloyl-ACP methyl ester carboxylesterase
LGLKADSRLSSRYVHVQGLRLHYRSSEGSEGIPFVLVPGLVISSLYWIPLAECLAIHGPVMALDLPGFGQSAGRNNSMSMRELAEITLRWLDELGIKRCYLVANSMGCQIATHAAILQPHRFETLVLIGPTIDPRHHSLVVQTLKLISDAFQEPVRLWLNWLFDFFRAGLFRSFGTTRMMFRDRIAERLSFIQLPTLVMRGEHDTTVPDRWARAAAQAIPNAEYVIIPREAHCAHYTAPELVTRHILEYAGQGVRP